MKNLKYIAVAISLLMGANAYAKAESTQPTVVFVHGAFLDGSSYNKVISKLTEKGIEAISVQNPLTSLQDDVEFVERIINESSDNVLLVGHSWGGAVISEAAKNQKVKSLLYIAGVVPRKSEGVSDLFVLRDQKKIPSAVGFKKSTVDSGGYIKMPLKEYRQYLVPGMSKSSSYTLYASQGRLNSNALGEKLSGDFWAQKSVHYVVTTEDQMIAPEMQEFMADRVKAKKHFLKSHHVPMLSHAHDISKIILEILKK